MSNDDSNFYNAWRVIVTDIKHRLIYSRHIDESLRLNTQSKVKGNQNAEAIVYKALKVVQFERSKTEFKKWLKGILEEFQTNDKMKEFGEYFYAHYTPRSKGLLSSTWLLYKY